MINKKIKVVMVTNHFGITGIGTVMMNYCKALDKNNYDLTILAGLPIAEKYEQECKEIGIHLIVLPSRHGEPLKHYVALWKALKAGEYDILHDHGNSPKMTIELMLARLAGIKVRIAHCHNKIPSNKLINKVFRYFFQYSYTKALACSELAGNWLFGAGNFQVLINGFNTEEFLYDEKQREMVRKQLNIEECYVIGHVGRFNVQKNQPFLLDIFEEVAKNEPKAVLLLVGTGPDFEKTKKLVDNHPFYNRIILYGESNKIPSLYSAMDVFVFPSKYEGLGLVAVEAQISGLPCVVSDAVPKEIVVGNKVTFVPLKESASSWSNIVLNQLTKIEHREDFFEQNKFSISLYEMNKCVEELDSVYQRAMEE